MKIYFLQIVLVLSVSISSAQDFIVKYTYDNNGNRVKQELKEISMQSSMLKSANISMENDSELSKSTNEFNDESKFSEDFNSVDLTIYPNPVKETLNISIESNHNINGQLHIYSVDGKCLLNKKIKKNSTSVNMSRFPHGTYLLQIHLNGSVKLWKILKD